MKRYLQYIFFLLLGLQPVLAQQFPVQVIPQTIPPRPVLLSDYANASSSIDKVQVQLILNDLTELNREVRLKVSIEGQGINAQSTDVVIGANPIFLEGGVTTTLGTAELAPYFDFQNLQVISPAAYGSSLPEGTYSFCFEVFDAFTGNVVSANSCTSFVLFDNDPPLLNLPLNAAGIQEMNPLNMVFQWTPRHINVSNVQYELSLSELWDLNIDPQAAFLSSPPIFQTTTTQTTFIYDNTQPSLIPGRRYAWRVRAFATVNAEEIGVFTNNGFSEIFYFDYQSQCDDPLFPDVEELTNRSAKIAWQGDFDHLDFTLKYREKNAESDWYDITTPREYVSIDDLKTETTYEYKVQGNCLFGSYGETLIQEFTTLSDEASAYQGCAIEPDPVNLENEELLPQLFINDSFTANDFIVRVQNLDSATPPFKGGGYVTLPWLGFVRIAVDFEDIQINTDNQLVAGKIETTYDPEWGNIGDIDQAAEDIFGSNGSISTYDADNIDIATVEADEDGNITIIDQAGNEFPITASTPLIITDSQGNQWAVNENGETIPLGQQAEGGAPDSSNTEGVDNSGSVTAITSQDVSIIFTDGAPVNYQFDPYENAPESLQNQYENIDMAGGSYHPPYKVVSNTLNEGTTTLTATANFSNGKGPDDIIFKTPQGVAIPHNDWDGNTVSLQLAKHFNFAKDEIIATVKGEDDTAQQQVAGKANLWHLEEKQVNVTLVQVNNAAFDETVIATTLNNIYKPVGVSFNVTSDLGFTIDPAAFNDGDPNVIDIGDSSVFAEYTADERTLFQAYSTGHTIAEDQYYVFITHNINTSKENVRGFMPLKRQYGFVFTDDNIGEVLAHELGHGVFGLQHYEEDDSKKFLMHTEFTDVFIPHMDWQTIHEPGLQLYLFQGDEDGEFAGKYAISPNFKYVFIQGSKTLYTDGVENFINGTLPGFVINYGENNEKKYIWNYTINQYVNKEDNNDIFSLEYKTILSQDSKINLLYNLSAECGQKAYVTITYGAEEADLNPLINGQGTTQEKQILLNSIISSRIDNSNGIPCSTPENENTSDWQAIPIDCSLEENSNIVSNRVQIIENMNLAQMTNEQVRDIIQNNYASCVFQQINIEIRKSIIDKLIAGDDGYWQFDTGFLVDDIFFLDNLILSTPIVERSNLLNYIKSTNYNWIQKLFNEGETTVGVGNDVDFGEITALFLKLGEWAWEESENGQFDLEIIPKTINLSGSPQSYYPGEQPFLIGNDNSAISYTINGLNYNILNTNVDVVLDENSGKHKIRLYNNYANQGNTTEYFDPFSGNYITIYNEIYKYDELYNPFEPVTIVAGDNNKFNLEVGKEYVVPAIYALSLQGTLEEQAKELLLRQIGNATLIVGGIIAAPFSGGTSLAGVAATVSTAGILVGTVDLYITSEISAGRIDTTSELYKNWNDFYQFYSLLEAGVNITNLGVQGFTKISTINLSKALSSLEDVIQSGTFIADKLNDFKSIVGGSSLNIAELTKLRDYLKVSVEFSKKFKPYLIGGLMTISVAVTNVDDAFKITNAVNRIEFVVEATNRITDLTTDVSTVITNNASKITQNLAKQPTIKIKKSPTASLEDGKVGTVLDNVNGVDYIITSMVIGSNIQHIVSKMNQNSIESIYELEEPIDESNSNNKCEFCPDKPGNLFNSQLCGKLNTLATNTGKNNAIHRLCIVPNLEALIDELLTFEVEVQTLFLTDIQGQAGGGCNSENDLCNSLISISLNRIRAWRDLISKNLARKKNISLDLFENINEANYNTLKDTLVIKLDDDKIIQFSSDYNPINNTIISEFNSNSRMVSSWIYVSNLTGKREWTRTSLPLLRKMSTKSNEIMETVGEYYSIHQKPASEGTPPFTHNGTPFDELGHPNFLGEVPIMVNGFGKIRYRPEELTGKDDLTGYGTDMTAANNWAFLEYNKNGQENFRKKNGQCEIKDPTSIFADENGWVLCVWHHHEDGKTLIPVPIETHNRACENGSSHTGGATIIKSYPSIIGFFPSDN